MTNIVFYENSQEELWFKEQYAELTLEKIIFSNDRKKIENFNGKSIDELKSSLRSFLPSIGNISESNTILYIPFDMKDKIIEILEYLGFKTKKGDTATIPTSEELGLVKGDIRSSFYDSMTIKDVHVLTEANDMDEIKDLFDKITSEDTNIDAVFLARTKDTRNPILINSTRTNTKIIINDYKNRILKFRQYVQVTEEITPGFTKAVFEFTPVTVTIVLVGKNQTRLLFFINETGEELANFDFNIDKYLPKITELVFNAGHIDKK